jgi:hypothetical protein
MPFPSSSLNQPSPPSDEHILLPPAAHISTKRSPFTAAGSLPGTPPTRLRASPNLQCQTIQEDAEDVVEQVGCQERGRTDLEAGRLAEISQRTGRSSSVCVFCLATRDICVEVGLNVVPTLFNTFGEGEFRSPSKQVYDTLRC